MAIPKYLNLEDFEVNAVEVQKAMAEEAKAHLPVGLLNKFSRNETSLTEDERRTVNEHIFTKKCERCRSQIEYAKLIFKL